MKTISADTVSEYGLPTIDPAANSHPFGTTERGGDGYYNIVVFSSRLPDRTTESDEISLNG